MRRGALGETAAPAHLVAGLLLAAIALAACGPSARDRTAEAGTAPVAPASIASAARPPSPRLTDPRWIRARDEDPLAQARLADEVGAAELLLGVEDRGEIEATALAALPFADDGEIALGRLGEIAASEPSRRRQVLPAILGIAGQPRRQRELLDPEGARRCGDALLAIARDRAAPAEDRAAAISAARALGEKGYVDAARIPADLDPP